MTIDPAQIQPGAQPWQDGGWGKAGSAPDDAFARILASLEPDLAGDAAQSAPAIPHIGSPSYAFVERPLLLDAPASPAREAAQLSASAGNNRVIHTMQGEGTTNLLRQIRQFLQAAEVDPATDLGVNGTLQHNRGVQAAVGLAVPGNPIARTAPLAPLAARPSSFPPLTPTREPFGPIPPARSASTAAPTRTVAASRTAPQPFSALLLQGAEGLQLVIRLPDLTPEVRVHLEDRIARLFARRGLAAPATLITGYDAGNNGRTA